MSLPSNRLRKEALRLRLAGHTYRAIGVLLGFSQQRAQQLLSPPAAIRKIVTERAGGKCQDCDLLLPRHGHIHHKNSRNGETFDDLDNLQLLCASCHQRTHMNSDYKESRDAAS